MPQELLHKPASDSQIEVHRRKLMEAGLLDADPDRPITGISDSRFIQQLKTLEKLKQFLFKEKVSIPANALGDIDLGHLNNLKPDDAGRLATEDEWRALDQKLVGLTPLLTPELRLKLRITELGFFFRRLPIIFMATSVAATFCLAVVNFLSAVSQITNSSLWYAIPYAISLLLWTVSQGGLGACAFLGISVATQTTKNKSASDSLYPATFLTDENILSTRIILGALFALLIGLPLSGNALNVIYRTFVQNSGVPPMEDYLVVLAPFMFGFSTSVVLAIFTRIVKGIEGLFGISSDTRR